MANIRTNQQYDEIRINLEARSLYNPAHPYQIQNPKLVNAINSIASLIPGKSINITNSPYGRLLGIGAQTPLTVIGAEMYARNLTQSITSFALADSIPSVNFTNLFDGDPSTHLLTTKQDYRITRDETKTTIGRIIQDITNQSPKLSNSVFTGRGNLAPFDKFPNQFDYIRNTGKGQLNQYYSSIGKNLYVQTSNDFIAVAKDQGYKIDKTAAKVLGAKTYFPENDPDNFPDGEGGNTYIVGTISNFRTSDAEDRVSEYGSNAVSNAMGVSKKKITPSTAQNVPGQEKDIDFDFSSGEDYGFNDNTNDQIIWGATDQGTMTEKFGVRSGALLFTKGLLQARGARAFFDQTKKKFVNRDGSLSYNGSPLTRHADGTVDRSRQHVIADQYNNYAKAIRFDGNQLYSAPVESVINKTVIPKMHPIIDTSNKVNNKNMMFSLENLAYILNDKGYIGDSLGTKLPLSEVGVNRGRVMWFAPYDVEVSETATAKYENTQLIGRSEPIYSYQSSERSARLGFKLIIDYPGQIDGQSHGDIAKFFAFGGNFNDNLKNIDIDKETSGLKQLEAKLDKVQPKQVLAPPTDLTSGVKSTVFFHNDSSSTQFEIDQNYEDGVKGSQEVTDDGLNTSLVSSVVNLVTTILTPETFALYDLNFVGGASLKFYDRDKEKQYNDALRIRRASDFRNYVEKIFTQNNPGLNFSKAGINVRPYSAAVAPAPPIPAQDGSQDWTLPIKQQRFAYVEVIPNGSMTKKENPDYDPEQKKVLEAEIEAKKTLINAAKKAQTDERIFNQIKKTDRVFKGFESMKKITLSPVFHSQTPEDFHRRLTFLHQCTRQGNAVQNTSTALAGVAVPTNSVFGRPPICVLRLGDMFHSKVIIETVDFDFTESIWDINPEGMGMQFMIANIDISMKIIGGQSLKGAIDVIQNAESFNYYANSTFYKNGVYQYARKVEDAQVKASETATNAKGEARWGKNVNGDFGGMTQNDLTQLNATLNKLTI